MFVFLFVCFIFCVFCVFVLFCVLFLLLYGIAVSFQFLHNPTDYCYEVENQLQYINIVSYIRVTYPTHIIAFWAVLRGSKEPVKRTLLLVAAIRVRRTFSG